VVHLCTQMDHGGAFQGAFNLHLALRKSGVESRILAREQTREVSGSTCWDPDPWGKKKLRKLSLKKIWSNRTEISNTHFSLDFLGVDVSAHPWVRAADVIHLHWVAEYLSSFSLARLACLNKPIFWTLHDLRPLTGGCHFPAGCGRFRSGCHNCPQLIQNRPPITSPAWLALRRAIQNARVQWIGPSRWICDMAKSAGLAGPHPIHHIPYNLEPLKKISVAPKKCRSLLGLPAQKKLILISASFLKEKRKGIKLAQKILRQVQKKRPSFRAGVLLVGQDSGHLRFPGCETYAVGKLDQRGMGYAYRAANVMLFSPLEDNLPFSLMEAMAHGLIPLASEVGGVPDLLPKEKFSELLFGTNQPKEAAKKLLCLMDSSKRRNNLKKKILKQFKTFCSRSEITRAHLALYQNKPAPGKNTKAKNYPNFKKEGGAITFPLFKILHAIPKSMAMFFLNFRPRAVE